VEDAAEGAAPEPEPHYNERDRETRMTNQDTAKSYTIDEAIALVIENSQKPATDKTRLSQNKLKRMHPNVRRANILWKRQVTRHLVGLSDGGQVPETNAAPWEDARRDYGVGDHVAYEGEEYVCQTEAA
jgi:hypothetical protein